MPRIFESDQAVPHSYCREAIAGKPRDATGGHWKSVTLRATKQYLAATAGRPLLGGHGKPREATRSQWTSVTLRATKEFPFSWEANAGRVREATGGHWTSVTLKATKE